MGLGIQLQVSQLIMSFDAFCLVVMMRTSDKSSLVERYYISLQAVNMNLLSWFWYNRFTWFTNWFSFHRLLCRQETSLKYQLSPLFVRRYLLLFQTRGRHFRQQLRDRRQLCARQNDSLKFPIRECCLQVDSRTALSYFASGFHWKLQFMNLRLHHPVFTDSSNLQKDLCRDQLKLVTFIVPTKLLQNLVHNQDWIGDMVAD